MRGVYILKTPNTSEFPKGQYYIGSSKNITNRVREHKKEIKRQNRQLHVYKVFAEQG